MQWMALFYRKDYLFTGLNPPEDRIVGATETRLQCKASVVVLYWQHSQLPASSSSISDGSLSADNTSLSGTTTTGLWEYARSALVIEAVEANCTYSVRKDSRYLVGQVLACRWSA